MDFLVLKQILILKKMSDEGQLPELFQSENAIHTVVSFNRFKNWGRRQQ
jgi:hypothetical protein